MTYVEPEIGPPTVQFGSIVPLPAPLLPVLTSESVAACPKPAQASKPATAKMLRIILCCPFGCFAGRKARSARCLLGPASDRAYEALLEKIGQEPFQGP